MTTGAKHTATLAVPKGCTRNTRTRIAQEVPIIVDDDMSGLTIFSPANLGLV
jgi:hypothetical protein